jgi:hypothetical protein
VPKGYSLDPQLGRWAQKQRFFFKDGRMDFEREAKLDELDFEFSGRDKRFRSPTVENNKR